MKRAAIVILLIICAFGINSSSFGTTGYEPPIETSYSNLMSRLLNGQVTKIKLIGDSITEGNGARNYIRPPATNPIIFNDGAGNIFREPDYSVKGWANSFRNFIATDFPKVQFINAGIGGKSTRWANANKEHWISESEDVVFVMLGTNDRWDNESPEAFKLSLESFLAYVDARSNIMIVMTAPPTRNDESGSYKFGMKKVDQVITEVSKRNGYTHISHYREILSYSERSGATLKTLIEENGSHPNNEGYDVMWKIIQEKLGIVDSTANWEKSNPSALYTTLMGSQYPYIKSTTPITFFETGKKTVVEMDSYSDTENFPEKTTGWLTTTRGFANDLYSNQVWEPRESYNIYKRTWNYGQAKWNEWRKLNAESSVKTTVFVTPGIINNGSVKEIEVLITGLDKNKTPSVTVIGTLPTGIMTSAHVDYKANRVFLRIFNSTSSSVNVEPLEVMCIQTY